MTLDPLDPACACPHLETTDLIKEGIMTLGKVLLSNPILNRNNRPDKRRDYDRTISSGYLNFPSRETTDLIKEGIMTPQYAYFS